MPKTGLGFAFLFGMRRVLSVLLFLFGISAVAPKALADMAHPWRNEDAARGYSNSADPESEETGTILYTVEDPYKDEVSLKDKIFDPELSKEITRRYYEKFGRTEAEIIQTRTPYMTTNFTEGQSQIFNEKDYQKQQDAFGNYMLRRVVEYHFDKQAKNNPDLKTVYETKQKLQKVDFSFSQNIKFRLKYKISSNTIDLTMKNPIVNLQTRMEFGEHEMIYTMYKDLGLDYSFITDYYVKHPALNIIGKKNLTPNLSISLTLSPFREYEVANPDDVSSSQTITIREKRAIAGLSYIF